MYDQKLKWGGLSTPGMKLKSGYLILIFNKKGDGYITERVRLRWAE